MAIRKRKSNAPQTPREQLRELARQAGCSLTSIGEIESLAGVDVRSHAERHALWFQFQHLFKGPVEDLFEAVMNHCAEIALRRIATGELCLVRCSA